MFDGLMFWCMIFVVCMICRVLVMFVLICVIFCGGMVDCVICVLSVGLVMNFMMRYCLCFGLSWVLSRVMRDGWFSEVSSVFLVCVLLVDLMMV